MNDLVQIFDALSDDKGLRVLNLLTGGEVCICDITDILKISELEALTSLRLLKRVGFVHYYEGEHWVYGIVVDIHTDIHRHILRHLKGIFKREEPFVRDLVALKERLSLMGRCERTAIA